MSTRRIAELAGVSPSTVSLALRNSPKIPAATKQKVLKIAKRLGYRPDGKLTELMSHLRLTRTPRSEACFGVVSLYADARPWTHSLHLTRIHDGMVARAEALGYRLEPFWLREPGMTLKRIRSILDARGIQGLLCFGSPGLEDEWPAELDHYAIVSQGLSIKTPLHRVVSHVYNDMWRTLDKVHALGYRRPGLVIGRYEEVRSAHAYLSVYHGWSHIVLGGPATIPVLQLDRVEEQPIAAWYAQHRPDVLIFVHHYDALPSFQAILKRQRLRMPQDVGVAVISQDLAGTEFSGLQENQHLIGAWAVELLVSRIMNHDFGIPANPRIEMVERQWIDGQTLRAPSK
jgi:LacI family transcriptional regulator